MDYDIKALINSGGGARGAFQLPILARMEKEHGPLYEYFDLMSGGSVGAIITSLLSTGKINASEFNLLFEDWAKKIFKRRFGIPLYDSQNFEILWNEVVGSDFKFGDAKTKLLITAVNKVVDDLGYEQSKIFKSWDSKDSELRMVDVIKYSFAAPVYFGTIAVPSLKSVFADPGIGINNCPIQETFYQLLHDGWIASGKNVLMETIGALRSEKTLLKTYDVVEKEQTSFKDILRFIKPRDGDEASRMSTGEQIRIMGFMCKGFKNVTFKFWDETVPDDMMGLDNVKHIPTYMNLGRLVAVQNIPIKSYNYDLA